MKRCDKFQEMEPPTVDGENFTAALLRVPFLTPISKNRNMWIRSLLLIVLFDLLSTCVLADQISTHTGATLGHRSREPKFHIEFHLDDSPFHFEDDRESIIMTRKDGMKFSCLLPPTEKVKIERPPTRHNTSSMVMETENRPKVKTPDELLEVLEDLCFVRHEGWWSYEFCYHQKIRQFHIEDDKVVQEFILGIYDSEATTTHNHDISNISTLKDPRAKDASQRYHAHQYKNGTICDLTNLTRETEVRFVCTEPRVMISSVTELSTCRYALTVQCPLICRHPLFQERPVSHTIHCNGIPLTTAGEMDGEEERPISSIGGAHITSLSKTGEEQLILE